VNSTYFERISLFAFLILASGIGMAAYLDPNDVAGGGGTLLRAVYGVFYLLFAGFVSLNFRSMKTVIFREKWLAVLWFWALASTAWSMLPGQTLRRSIALLGTMLIGLYLGAKFRPRQQLTFIAGVTGLGALSSLVAGVLFPHFGIVQTGEWIGVYYQKNVLGHTMAIGLFCFLFLALGERKLRPLYWSMAVLCGILMFLSQSVTAMFISALMLVVLFFRRVFTLPARTLVIATSVVLAIAVPASIFIFQNIDAIFGFFGRDASLTGRIPLWRIVFEQIAERPIFGAGYSAFWFSSEADRIHAAIKWSPMHSHNGYFETLLALGAIGLLILLIGLCSSLLRGLREARDAQDIYDFWPVFFMLLFAFDNMTESWILVANALVWTLFTANTYWLAKASLEFAPVHEDALDEIVDPGLPEGSRV
jgi:exopolysaccharide production protein ExoQ